MPRKATLAILQGTWIAHRMHSKHVERHSHTNKWSRFLLIVRNHFSYEMSERRLCKNMTGSQKKRGGGRELHPFCCKSPLSQIEECGVPFLRRSYAWVKYYSGIPLYIKNRVAVRGSGLHCVECTEGHFSSRTSNFSSNQTTERYRSSLRLP